MTTWGSTPTCRGFGQFNGFYSASSDYFTHHVGPGYDYKNNFAPDPSVYGVYTTQAVTTAVSDWIRRVVTPETKTHAMVINS